MGIEQKEKHLGAFNSKFEIAENDPNALPPAITESARKDAVCGGIRILPEIPPGEISLIGAHFGGTEEWRKILKTGISQRTLDAVWGGIGNPPRIPHHKIPMIYAPLVRMGGMGRNFQDSIVTTWFQFEGPLFCHYVLQPFFLSLAWPLYHYS